MESPEATHKSMHQHGLNLSEEQLEFLVSSIKDYQLTHGSLLKNVRQVDEYTAQARPIGVSVIPSPFPRACYDKAVRLQATFNELYVKIAMDEVWLEKNLGSFLVQDAFASTSINMRTVNVILIWNRYIVGHLSRVTAKLK